MSAGKKNRDDVYIAILLHRSGDFIELARRPC